MNKWRNTFITVFVIFWCLAFHYESVRHFYLNPLFDRNLPKIKFLFPPAGWIMFFRVDSAYGHRQIYGVKDEQAFEIDPHEVFRVRTIGFDNVHRGVVSGAADPRNRLMFCRQLYKRFEGYEDFRVVYTFYPDFIDEPLTRYQRVLYGCADIEGVKP